MTPVKDYYALLGIEPSSGQAAIKRAYRARAKSAHPDLAGTVPGADMRDLNEAYETLRDPERRRNYDRVHRALFEQYSFDYRAFLKAQPDDPGAMAKLIFYDILHGREDEALGTFARYAALGLRLVDRLDREDAMDIGFLLAEEEAARGRPVAAFRLYAETARMELEKPYFRHFFAEVRARLRELVRTGLDGARGREGLECYEDFALLVPEGKDRALAFRKMAELYARNSMADEAVLYAERAMDLDPAQAGAAALLRKLRRP